MADWTSLRGGASKHRREGASVGSTRGVRVGGGVGIAQPQVGERQCISMPEADTARYVTMGPRQTMGEQG